MRGPLLIAGSCVMGLVLVYGAGGAVSDVADAAMKQNLPAVRSLLQQKADVNAPQADGATAMHWATRLDDAPMAELLIKAGANVKAANRFGVTPLELACINGNPAMIEMLLKAGADANAPLSELGETPLMMAARTGNIRAVEILINHGANVNAKEDSKGQTALMWAASERHPDVVRILIDHGADPNLRSKVVTTGGRGQRGNAGAGGGAGAGAGGGAARGGGGGGAAAPAAAQPPAAGPEDAAMKKIESETNPDSRLALLLDFEKEYPKSRLLVDVYQYMVQIYQQKNDEPKAKVARDKLAPLERQQQQRQAPPPTPAATSGGITALTLAAREGSLESARILLSAGADVNAPMANASTPLLLAIINGHYELANFLLDHGANPNLADKDGKAALYTAVEMRNLATTDVPGPAADKGEALELIKTLLNRGVDPNARLTAKPPFRGGINRSWLSEPGATPFYRAAVSGDITTMRLLLAYGADPYIPTTDNTTPLMVAAGVGYLTGSTFTWSERDVLEALELCLQFSNVNAANSAGLTALHGAAFRGWNAGVQALVDKGARLDAKDKQGRTPMNWADAVYRGGGVAPVRQVETIALLEKLMK
jgi:ankyrin repeat protein